MIDTNEDIDKHSVLFNAKFNAFFQERDDAVVITASLADNKTSERPLNDQISLLFSRINNKYLLVGMRIKDAGNLLKRVSALPTHDDKVTIDNLLEELFRSSKQPFRQVLGNSARVDAIHHLLDLGGETPITTS